MDPVSGREVSNHGRVKLLNGTISDAAKQADGYRRFSGNNGSELVHRAVTRVWLNGRTRWTCTT
jgi:hypothetical protein